MPHPLLKIADDLCDGLSTLRFQPPVAHVYNPLNYARPAYKVYVERFGGTPKPTLLVGMNPGPWGMVQTGIPFGAVDMVRSWLRIDPPFNPPENQHPQRKIQGLTCPRREISGQRLWGWARDRYVTPERFFERFFVANYCPLAFLEASGRNRTPNNLPAAGKKPLLAVCDEALRQTVDYFQPRFVIGVGTFAGQRIKKALAGMPVRSGHILHPSPASPKANRGWAAQAEAALQALGVAL